MTCTTTRNHAIRPDYAPPTSSVTDMRAAHRIADVVGTVIGFALFCSAVYAVLRYL